MKDECLICKAPLIYLEADEEMRCAICGKRFLSKTRCLSGHFVCNECHMAGLDAIVSICLSHGSKDPVEIIRTMMAQPFCHMHGPEHHVMVGAALLTAYHNAGGEIDLEKALSEMMKRGKSEHRHVRFDHFLGHAADRRALRPLASDDGKSPLRHRRNRRPALLQARFLPLHPMRRRLRGRALRRPDGAAGNHLRLFRAEQSMHRQPLPLSRKIINPRSALQENL